MKPKRAPGTSNADRTDAIESPSPPGNPPVRFRLPQDSEFRKVDATDAGRSHEDKLKEYLRSSLQMQHLAILSGSGTSTDADGPSMSALWRAALKLDGVPEATAKLSFEGKDNIEEFLSRCDAFLELNHDDMVARVRARVVGEILSQCRAAGGDTSKLAVHRSLLRKVARRRVRDSRVKLFTTNYDRCFEVAAGELGLVPIDGFSFGSPRRFDPRFFEYDIVKRSPNAEGSSFVPGVFQYFKLHGSVDWRNRNGTIEVDPLVAADDACLIYPARAKFQRSYEQPHLELMARYLATLREPNTCLVVVGFGFNDDHLSGPILAALRSNPHFRLIVVCRDPESKLQSAVAGSPWFELKNVASQVDATFIAATFSRFVELIPDLSALSRGEQLESLIGGIKVAP
jgi:hypothetical protein